MFLERLLRLKPPPTAEEEIPSLPPRLAGPPSICFSIDWLRPDSRAGAARRRSGHARSGHLAGGRARPPARRGGRRGAALRRDRRRTLCAGAGSFDSRARRNCPGARLERRTREILAVESEGSAELLLDGAVRTIRFRADRVERSGDGDSLLLTDYKSGAPVSAGKKAPTRDRALAKSIREGKNLQLAAYALARLDGATTTAGRLLFVRPDLAEQSREVYATAGDAALAGAPWSAIFRARELGAFLPRLVGADLRSTFDGCDNCDVRVACVQGDSGARLRFERWAASRVPGTARGESAAEGAARELFEIHPPKRRESAPDSGANEAAE